MNTSRGAGELAVSHSDVEPEDVLPTQTSDDLTDPADRLDEESEDDDERLRREVPPHHGD